MKQKALRAHLALSQSTSSLWCWVCAAVAAATVLLRGSPPCIPIWRSRSPGSSYCRIAVMKEMQHYTVCVSMVVNCYRNVNAFNHRPLSYVPNDSGLQLAFAEFATRSVQNLQTSTKISRNKKKKIAIKHTFVTSRLSMASGNREFQLRATFVSNNDCHSLHHKKKNIEPYSIIPPCPYQDIKGTNQFSKFAKNFVQWIVSRLPDQNQTSV